MTSQKVKNNGVNGFSFANWKVPSLRAAKLVGYSTSGTGASPQLVAESFNSYKLNKLIDYF